MPLISFDKRTLDHQRYIKEVLPVAKKYGDQVFGNDWTYQENGRKTTHTLFNITVVLGELSKFC